MKKILQRATAVIVAAIIACSFAAADVGNVWALPSSGKSPSNDIYVRANPGGDVVGRMETGQTFPISDVTKDEEGYDWYKVTIDFEGNDVTGWVRGDLIETSEGSADKKEESEKPKNETVDTPKEVENDQPETEDTETEAPEEEGEPVAISLEAAMFTVGDTGYDLVEEFPEELVPEGFKKGNIAYNGSNYQAAKYEKYDMVLVYVVNNQDPEDFRIFAFDPERDSLYGFNRIQMGEKSAIIINVPEKEAKKVSPFYTAVEYSTEAGPVLGFRQAEPFTGYGADADTENMLYVYAVNEDGEAGWYTFDGINGTLQRSQADMAYVKVLSEEDAPIIEDPVVTDAKNRILPDAETEKKVIVGGAGLIILLFILMLIFLIICIRRRRIIKVMEGEEFFMDESFKIRNVAEPDKEPVLSKKAKRKMAKMMAAEEPEDSPIVVKEPEPPVEEEEPEGYYDDDDEVEEVVKTPEEPEKTEEPEQIEEPQETEETEAVEEAEEPEGYYDDEDEEAPVEIEPTNELTEIKIDISEFMDEPEPEKETADVELDMADLLAKYLDE